MEMDSSYNPQDSEILTLELSLLLEQNSIQRPFRGNQLSASYREYLQVLEKHSGPNQNENIHSQHLPKKEKKRYLSKKRVFITSMHLVTF